MSSQIQADEPVIIVKKDTVLYHARDSLIYQKVPEQIIELFGDANIQYQDMSLNADYVKIFVDSQKVFATFTVDSMSGDTVGIPVLVQLGDTIYGRQVYYDLKKKKGKIFYGESAIEQGFFLSDQIEAQGKKDIYMFDCQYTTCDLIPEKQHYFLKVKDMKVVAKNKAMVRHVKVYLNRIPYFYLPFQVGAGIQDTNGYFYSPKFPVFYFPSLVYPVNNDRHSGILFPKIGKETIEGTEYYVISETGYFWAINDYTDYLFKFNFYATNHYLVTNRFRYKKRYLYNGNIDFTTRFRESSREYKIIANHDQKISPYQNLTANINYTTDQTLNQLTSNSIHGRNNSLMYSKINYTNRLGFGTFNLNFTRKEDIKRNTVQQSMPSTSFQLKSINPYGVSISYNIKGDYYYSREDSTEQYRYGLIQNFNLKKNLKLKSYLKIIPSISATDVFFDYALDADSSKIKNVHKFKYRASLKFSNTLYGVFAPDILGLKVIRHKVDPSVSISYQAKDDDPRNFQSFSYVNYSPNRSGSNTINFSLNNVFQAKYLSNEKEKKIKLFDLNFSTYYNAQKEKEKWNNLNSRLLIKPFGWTNIQISSIHSFYKDGDTTYTPFQGLPEFRSFSLSNINNYRINLKTTQVGNFFLPIPKFFKSDKTLKEPDDPFAEYDENRLEENEPGYFDENELQHNVEQTRLGIFNESWEGEYQPTFNLSIGHIFRYNKSYLSEANISHQINFNLQWTITQRWKLSYQTAYNVQDKDFVSQTIRLNHDLHCWEFLLNSTIDDTYRTFHLKLYIKEFPDIKIEDMRRSYDY